MAAMSVARRFEKSTTGRFISAGVRLLDRVAPRAAQRLVFDRFATPLRRRGAPDLPGFPPHRFTLDDGLVVWDWGDGPTVLLVHGWNGSAAQMSGFVFPLLRAGCYVAAPDLPAHGASPGRQTNIRELTDAILRVGRRVGPVHAVVAHSFGAAATVAALSRGLRAERVVLLAPAAALPAYAGSFAAAAGLSQPSVGGLLARIDARVGGIARYDPVAAASGQRADLLVLHDRSDREVPFEAGRAIASAWPGGRIEAVNGAGHTRMLRNPAVIERAASFIRAVEPLAMSA
jgi:pimeloyl-ACP methyl ester carboxylesterase